MKKMLQAMRSLTLAAIFAPFLTLAVANGQAVSVQESYKLSPGDSILIDVFGEEDLSMEVMLDDTGIIDYPFLGTLDVEGLTVVELEQILLDGLKGPYLVEPDITVAIKQYRNIYVNGEVQNPGAYAYEPGMTVEKAVAMAGGFTERASRKKLKINRAADPSGSETQIAMVDPVRPGDIITVPQSFF